VSANSSNAATFAASLPPEFSVPEFRARRTQNWILLGLLYAFFYMTRYNYTATNAQLAELIGWRNTELGVFETVMPLVYGLSVFLNGPLADRIGGKRAFLIGASGVFVMNLLFGASISLVATPAVWITNASHQHVVSQAALISGGLTNRSLLVLMVTLWGINGYFQSFGALAIIKVNAQWFHVRERGTFAAVFGVLIRLGLILAFSGVPLLAKFGLRYAFWVPAACVGVLFFLVWRFVENSPVDAGFPAVDTGDGGGVDDGRPMKFADVLRKVFASRAAWIIAGCSMMIGIVRRSVVDAWYPKYFTETFSVPKSELGSFVPYQVAVWGIAILGICGGFAFGFSSDRIYGGRRAPVITYGFVGMAVMLALLGIANRLGLGPWVTGVCLMMLSFFVNGAHGMISGAASMDFGGRKAAATAAGLFDGMQYLAAAFVGVGVGTLVDHWGWGAWPFAPIPFACIGAGLMATLWRVAPGRKAH
jgi:OPA family glycerol-3-phosphate transporter-like MFS transporter